LGNETSIRPYAPSETFAVLSPDTFTGISASEALLLRPAGIPFSYLKFLYQQLNVFTDRFLSHSINYFNGIR
jgi:hypothetical protein